MLTPREFRAILALLDWDTPTACRRLCVHEVTLCRYRTGHRKIPPQVERILSYELRSATNFKNHRRPAETLAYMLGG